MQGVRGGVRGACGCALGVVDLRVGADEVETAHGDVRRQREDGSLLFGCRECGHVACGRRVSAGDDDVDGREEAGEHRHHLGRWRGDCGETGGEMAGLGGSGAARVKVRVGLGPELRLG